MIRRVIMGTLVGLALLLSACGGDGDSTPVDEGAILYGRESLQKEVATLALTPTPTPVISGADAVAVAPPQTVTVQFPSPTPKPTVYAGTFMGDGSAADPSSPTLAPYQVNPYPAVSNPVVDGGPVVPPAGGAVSGTVAGRFANAYPGVQTRLGTPIGSGTTVQMAVQRFENGIMYWQGNKRQIYALANDRRLFQVADQWQDGMPERSDDPAFAPPRDGVMQPIRGFGLAWRSNPSIKDALGWGLQSENTHEGLWQDFERGAMFVGADGQVYALFTAEGQHSGPLSP